MGLIFYLAIFLVFQAFFKKNCVYLKNFSSVLCKFFLQIIFKEKINDQLNVLEKKLSKRVIISDYLTNEN